VAAADRTSHCGLSTQGGFALATATSDTPAYCAEERFVFASTFKAMLAAAARIVAEWATAAP
jgi:hypothetical protein